jgi:diguanylate cyclase (GGDEF)-like protein
VVSDRLEVDDPMSPSPGVRPDLATRLRQSKRALESRLGKAETHVELMRAAHASLDPDRIGELILAKGLEWLRASHGALVAADHDGEALPLAGRGLTGKLPGAALDIARWVFSNGQAFATADLRNDARLAGACGAAFAVPLRCRSRVVAVLVVVDRARARVEPGLGTKGFELLTTALDGPAVALDNALRLRRAEALSVTDDLTQLYNSRYLNQVLRRETKRASRNGRPLSLLFVDLDGFKNVNDKHGHLAGSRGIAEAADVIRRSARETDVIARFGGDEFALVLPDTGSEGAVAVAERVRERIAEHRFLDTLGLDIHLTVSVGVATLPDVAASVEELVAAADGAMYRVKATGKNGVIVARGEPAAE